ncbi:MAG: Holliday junction resolvase RuvX [Clostridia bacterium]|nr:Holliday junction resolvase RuvX [Clostridia bacterium]MBQ3056110.1 Holliday junction resolvase RuvX [Clostridia bacterium]
MSFEKLKETKGRVLGIDFGEARTGLAVSDASRMLASGIGNIKGGGLERSVEAIAEVVQTERISGIVLGLPVNMNGTEGPRAARIRQFAAMLEERMPDVPVALMDERMTTMAASRFLNETNTRGQRRKGVIDTLSAEIILQNALDKLRR